MAHMIFSDGEYRHVKPLTEKKLAFKVELRKEAESELIQKQYSLENIARLVDGRLTQKARKAAK